MWFSSVPLKVKLQVLQLKQLPSVTLLGQVLWQESRCDSQFTTFANLKLRKRSILTYMMTK